MVKLVVTIIPDNEIWLHQPKAADDLQTAMAWARANSPIDSQVDSILEQFSDQD